MNKLKVKFIFKEKTLLWLKRFYNSDKIFFTEVWENNGEFESRTWGYYKGIGIYDERYVDSEIEEMLKLGLLNKEGSKYFRTILEEKILGINRG